MKFKKQNLTLVLGILLLILMYKTPKFLKDFAAQPLGKFVLVCLLAYIAVDCDTACAIIFASIIIVLLHDNKENFVDGNLRKLMKKASKNADNAEKKMGFKVREGMKEGAEESDDHKHEDHHSSDDNEEKKEDEDEDEDEEEDENEGDDSKEGFVSLDKMKQVTNKLQNYLGFSITDLDRFMKTSSEKNTIASTKDQ